MPGVKAPVNAKLAQVQTVQIDPDGTFRYILCKIYEGNNIQDSKLIVRGTRDAMFHSDIYDSVDACLESDGISCECIGGGKIKHDLEHKSLEIFGKSQAYGKADHKITATLLGNCYAGYNITWYCMIGHNQLANAACQFNSIGLSPSRGGCLVIAI